MPKLLSKVKQAYQANVYNGSAPQQQWLLSAGGKD
ncbi:hypothetical protein HaLaN_00318 [Haematococcus lacustris]|uniref:Uncharacterized protein n=1 Tax=Haematococcus lacustris TaxID=44745 RepID=A0A699YFI0_HAELA|nr:hypothetical protein HaLaN_00318 [Haematococcus lacustris]